MITKKAEELIPNEVREVEKKMKKYKLSLISHEFEQFYVNKRLDTNINSFEIQDYYNNHLYDFVLNDYVVKCLFSEILHPGTDIDAAFSVRTQHGPLS